MRWLKAFAGYSAPIFLILSPILSYSDQALAMHRNRSSAGFSLDVPLIMLVACILRVFYYPGARFDTTLLIQAFCNIAVQLVLLKVALDNRPSPSSKGGEMATPFAGSQDGLLESKRPYNFWQWRSPKPYWQFLLYLFIGLTVLEFLVSPFTSVYPLYSNMIGYTGLTVEAMLAVPQIVANARARSCKGFRVSILASWLLGDAMKMFWFFTSTTEIPWAFKLCGIFQAGCDLFLGLQYLMYGNGERMLKDKESPVYWPGHSRGMASGRGTPTGRRTSAVEKDYRL